MPIAGDTGTVILDKSAFEGFSRDEHIEFEIRYRHNITPVLLREIHTDLMSPTGQLTMSADDRVRTLAKRFHGSGRPPNVDFHALCRESLLGNEITMDGRGVPDGGVEVPDPGGGTAILYDLTRANHDILRWASGRFGSDDRKIAATQRLQNAMFSVGGLRGRLRVEIRRPRNDADIATVADAILRSESNQAALMAWLVEQQLAPGYIERRWEAEGRPSLATHEFGFGPAKIGQKSAETKALAVEKLLATREARHTQGKKQKKDIKGTIAASTPAPNAPANAQPATPPVNVVVNTTAPAATNGNGAEPAATNGAATNGATTSGGAAH